MSAQLDERITELASNLLTFAILTPTYLHFVAFSHFAAGKEMGIVSLVPYSMIGYCVSQILRLSSGTVPTAIVLVMQKQPQRRQEKKPSVATTIAVSVPEACDDCVFCQCPVFDCNIG
uniref:Uncharacterized protein n=1 Tax=Glossina pallidipes TaxID=7398 RepID=A0A1A9ZNN3_GLOPL